MIENQAAEQAVIACALLSNTGRGVLARLSSTDFTDTRHRVIANAIRDMVKRDLPVDQLTVTNELANQGKLTTPGGAGGTMYLVELGSIFVVAENAEFYADQVRTATRVRLASIAARDLAEWTTREGASGEVDALLSKTRLALDAIPGPLSVDDDDANDAVGAILSERVEDTDWIIPGFAARQDRAVLVAAEGIMKTTLGRQVAIAVAGGLNPWTGQRVSDGRRVLFIDAENSRNQSRRAYQWISQRVARPMIAPGWKGRIIHKTRNDGVDLPGRDANWFADVAGRVNPDLLILGPAYKLMRGDPQKDRDVQDLLDVIDRVRVAQNCAVMVETHAPHGMQDSRKMRPYGSSVWLRWPEVGPGYQRDMDETIVQQERPDHLIRVDWRGQREARDWPDLLRHGEARKREMPWCPTRDDWAPSVRSSYTIPESETKAA